MLKPFECEICGSAETSGVLERGDGAKILLCNNCDIGKIEKIPSNLKEFYSADYFKSNNENTRAYSDYESTAVHTTLWVKRFIQGFIEKGDVLDVGCANGYFLNSLGTNYNCYGVEISENAFKEAESKGIRMIAHDLMDPIIEQEYGGAFDVVTALATFEHFLEFRRSFDICLKLLKPDGFLVFEIPILSTSINSEGWLSSSYEHIWYPSVSSIDILLRSFGNWLYFGQEVELKGFPPTYIGIVTKSSNTKDLTEGLFKAMTKPTLDGLNENAILLNISFHIFHSFSLTPERILYLPRLLEKEANPLLLKHVANFWYNDSINNIYWKQQAENWKNAYDNLLTTTTENAGWWKQQAENWKKAYETLSGNLNSEGSAKS